MKLIKKDWMYDFKVAIIVLAIALAGISIIFLFITGMIPEAREGLKAGYEEMYTMMLGIICIYPIWIFAAISDPMKSGKVYVNVSNLPITKKRLFFQGVKQWLMVFIIASLASSGVMAALCEQSTSYGMLYVFSLIRPLGVFLFMSIISMQVIAGIIFTIVKKIRWYKITGMMIVLNVCLISLYALIGVKLSIDINNSMGFMFGIIGILALISLGIFIFAWRDVEKIHQ